MHSTAAVPVSAASTAYPAPSRPRHRKSAMRFSSSTTSSLIYYQLSAGVGGRPCKGVGYCDGEVGQERVNMLSWVAMERILERQIQSEAKHRRQAAGRPLRSDAKRLTDGELLAKL